MSALKTLFEILAKNFYSKFWPKNFCVKNFVRNFGQKFLVEIIFHYFPLNFSEFDFTFLTFWNSQQIFQITEKFWDKWDFEETRFWWKFRSKFDTNFLKTLTGTPAAMAIARASTLSPILWTMSGSGPIKIIPLSTQAWAKSARSDKNPYPGWIASTFFSFAIRIISGMSK